MSGFGDDGEGKTQSELASFDLSLQPTLRLCLDVGLVVQSRFAPTNLGGKRLGPASGLCVYVVCTTTYTFIHTYTHMCIYICVCVSADPQSNSNPSRR